MTLSRTSWSWRRFSPKRENRASAVARFDDHGPGQVDPNNAFVAFSRNSRRSTSRDSLFSTTKRLKISVSTD